MENNLGDFEAYSKCLFRTISYYEVKTELEDRGINFSPSDTYYILTLKLRSELLRKADPNCAIARKVDEEVAAYKAQKHTVGSLYKCCLVGCNFACTNHDNYLRHLEFVHQSSSARLTCNYRHDCSRNFPSFGQLKSHVLNFHKKNKSSVLIRQNQLVEQLTRLRCVEASCGHATVSSISHLKTHLYSHTGRKEQVRCIFCCYKSDTTGSLKSHFSRKHKIQTVDQLINGVVQSSSNFENTENTKHVESEDTNFEPYVETDDEDSCDEEEESEEDLEEVFVKALAITVILFD